MSAEYTDGEFTEVETPKSEPKAALVKAEVKPKPSAITTAKNIDELPLADAAKLLMGSGLVRSGEDLGKILTKLSLGRDLGLPAVTAINGIGIGPNSSIILSAALMRLLINRSGRYKLRVRQRDAKGSVIEVFERMSDGEWESCGVPISFTPDDAKRAGLDGKDTYKKWPVDMYYARCLAAAFRTYCPDCAAGNAVYLGEEIDNSGYRTDPVTMDLVPEAEVESKSRPAAKTKSATTAAAAPSTRDRCLKLMEETGTPESAICTAYKISGLDVLTEKQWQGVEQTLQQKKRAAPAAK